MISFVLISQSKSDKILIIMRHRESLNVLFEKRRDNPFMMIVGLALGSIVTMFLNPDIYDVYSNWTSFGESIKNITFGAVFLAIGCLISYLLVRYQRKVNNKSQENNQ